MTERVALTAAGGRFEVFAHKRGDAASRENKAASADRRGCGLRLFMCVGQGCSLLHPVGPAKRLGPHPEASGRWSGLPAQPTHRPALHAALPRRQRGHAAPKINSPKSDGRH
jgi:hypothetical protein